MISNENKIFNIFFQYIGVLCNRPMGIRNGKLPNKRMTASSMWDRFHAPYLARLHKGRSRRYVGAWSARYNNYYQWLQVDFGRPAKIVRISTQGRADADQWVTYYKVAHSLDRLHYVYYKYRDSVKVSVLLRLSDSINSPSFPIKYFRFRMNIAFSLAFVWSILINRFTHF